MKHSELLKKLSVKTGLTQEQTQEFVKEFINIIKEKIKKEDSVHITGFWSFSGKKVKERKAKNPKTKETVIVKAHIKPNFSFTDTFKKKINEK